MDIEKIKNELHDLRLILTDKYKAEILTRYRDSLSSIDELTGDRGDLSALFYLYGRRLLYLLDNDEHESVRAKDIAFSKRIYPLLRLIGASAMKCKQVIENRKYIENPNEFDGDQDDEITLPNKPVIFVANHGFRDDILATILATKVPVFGLWGSLPLFYNTLEGAGMSLIGNIIVNRNNRNSRKASLKKAARALELGSNILIFPEGGWNKSIEKPVLDLWKGFYRLAVAGEYDVVPITHYVRDMEVLDKKNMIHTIVDDPIPLYKYSEEEGIALVRDTLASWRFKMAQIYGRSTRAEEMGEFHTSDEVWKHRLKIRMEAVSAYDPTIERKSEYIPKRLLLPEEVFASIANVNECNINAQNIGIVTYAKYLIRERENTNYQQLF